MPPAPQTEFAFAPQPRRRGVSPPDCRLEISRAAFDAPSERVATRSDGLVEVGMVMLTTILFGLGWAVFELGGELEHIRDRSFGSVLGEMPGHPEITDPIRRKTPDGGKLARSGYAAALASGGRTTWERETRWAAMVGHSPTLRGRSGTRSTR